MKKILNTRRKTRNTKRVKRTLRRRRYLSKKRGGAWWNRTKKNVNNNDTKFEMSGPTSDYRRERAKEREEAATDYNEKQKFIDDWLENEWKSRYDNGPGQHEPTKEEGEAAWEEHLKNNVM